MNKEERGLDHSASGAYSHAKLGGAWTRYPQTIPPEYYQAIGEICARWAWLEFQLGVIAREMLGINKPQGFSVTGGMSMRSVTTVLLALTLSGLPKDRPQLKRGISELAEKLNNLRDFRNEYAHALWGYENEQNQQLGIIKLKTPEDRVELNWISKKITKIQQDAAELAGHQVTAQEITDALKGRPSQFE